MANSGSCLVCKTSGSLHNRRREFFALGHPWNRLPGSMLYKGQESAFVSDHQRLFFLKTQSILTLGHKQEWSQNTSIFSVFMFCSSLWIFRKAAVYKSLKKNTQRFLFFCYSLFGAIQACNAMNLSPSFASSLTSRYASYRQLSCQHFSPPRLLHPLPEAQLALIKSLPLPRFCRSSRCLGPNAGEGPARKWARLRRGRRGASGGF